MIFAYVFPVSKDNENERRTPVAGGGGWREGHTTMVKTELGEWVNHIRRMKIFKDALASSLFNKPVTATTSPSRQLTQAELLSPFPLLVFLSTSVWKKQTMHMKQQKSKRWPCFMSF
jgi:hypothetical protein